MNIISIPKSSYQPSLIERSGLTLAGSYQRDLVKGQCTARLPTRRTTETITLPRTDETAHAITPYRCEGTNWVNRSLAFYISLRNRKNKFASLSRLTLEQELKKFVFLNLQSRSYYSHHPLQGYIILVEFWFGRNK